MGKQRRNGVYKDGTAYSRGDKPVEDVHEVLDKLVRRVASELGVELAPVARLATASVHEPRIVLALSSFGP